MNFLVLTFIVLPFSTLFSGLANAYSQCEDLILNSRLDMYSSRLVIDDLIYIFYKYKKWDSSFEEDESSWSYTVDLTCFQNLIEIENAKKSGNFIDLISLSTTPVSSNSTGFIKVEYQLVNSKGRTFMATIRVTKTDSIKSLSLSYNQLLVKIAADSFVLLSNLTRLDLSNNRIAPFGSTTSLVPQSFNGLGQLTHLDLSYNPLVVDFAADFFISVKQLICLNLSSSEAASSLQPNSLNGLDVLEYLDLSSYRVSNLIYSLNPEVFYGLRSLKVLDLTGIHLLFGTDGLFQGLGNLTDLILNDFKFSYQFNVNIPIGTFNFSNKLERLEFSAKTFTYTKPLGDLRGLNNLKWLRFRNFRVQIDLIDRGLFPERTKIAHLDLSLNKLDARIFEYLAFINTTLTWLSLEGNEIVLLNSSPANLSVLSELQELYLRDNIKIELNVSHFFGLSQLRVLDLSLNKIERLTVRCFRGLSNLKQLNLEDNFIQTIENGSFVPLKSLARLNLMKNKIKNLYFFGLSHECAIYHDGLSLFNISFIDLERMSRGRDRSFIYKTLHLRGSRHVSTYRNIRVNWRSASAQPNCSIYFHVLRKYKIISFEIDHLYIQNCLNQDLDLANYTFYQEEFSVIENLRSLRPLRTLVPQSFAPFGATTDGYLIGLSHNGTRIAILKLMEETSEYTFQTSDTFYEIKVISDDLMVTFVNGCDTQRLWNITVKSNIAVLFELPSILAQHYLFPFLDHHLATFNRLDKVFCFVDLLQPELQYECRMFEAIKWKPLDSFTILKKEFLVFYSFIYVEMWSLRDLKENKTTSRATVMNPGHTDKMRSVYSSPNDLLITTTFYGHIKVWSMKDGDSKRSLELKVSTRDTEFSDILVIRSLEKDDILLALVTSNGVRLFSMRYSKLVETIESPNKLEKYFSSFDRGLLIVDGLIYSF